jgi:ATP citrate (pro-S)-lyase
MILSGGGASVTLADEVDNLGFGNLLANYGEYSGGPSSEESSLYATQVIDLLLASNQKNKVLVIAGGVANFTDVEVTFRGIIDALNSRKKSLNQQKIKVFIRRGGPNEKQGLANIKLFLDSIDVESVIAGSDMILTNIVKLAVKGNE